MLTSMDNPQPRCCPRCERLPVRGIEFGSGHDMNELLGEFDIRPTPTEIEQ